MMGWKKQDQVLERPLSLALQALELTSCVTRVRSQAPVCLGFLTAEERIKQGGWLQSCSMGSEDSEKFRCRGLLGVERIFGVR